MKKLFIALILLALSPAYGQKWVDLGNAYWRVSPFNKIDGFSEKRTMNMFVGDAKAPIVLGEKNILIIGIEYQYTSITSKSIFFPDYRFSSSMLQLGLEHKWNERSKMLFMFVSRFNTDYQYIGYQSFQWGGLAFGTTSRSENFDWKYGLYYNGELFGPMVVPLFGFNWKINEKWRFKMVIPLNLELSYKPNNWLRTGARFDGINASYTYQTLPGDVTTNGYIDKADNNAWAFCEFHLGKNVWFHVKAGHSILRKYRYFSDGDKMNLKLGPINIGDNRNSDNPKAVPILFKNGWSFEGRIIYRLPID